MVSQIVVGTNATSPSTPIAGTLSIFAKSADNKVYTLDETGLESIVGSGGGATGGGTDEIFVEMDAVMTQSKTIGDSTYASGVTFDGTSSIIMTGHNFVVDSLIHFLNTLLL